MKYRTFFITAMAGFLLLALCGCEASDIEFIGNLADEWAQQKNIKPTNPDGTINLEGLFNAGGSYLGLTGDAETRALMQLAPLLMSMREADKLADQGLLSQDLAPVDAAIKARPKDYHYGVVRGVVLLTTGQSAAAEQAWVRAAMTAQEQNPTKPGGTPTVGPFERDRMNTIDQLVTTSKSPLAPDAKARLAKVYCVDAQDYATRFGSTYYQARARTLFGVNCNP